MLKAQAIVGVNRETRSPRSGPDRPRKADWNWVTSPGPDVFRAESVYHAARRTLIESEELAEDQPRYAGEY